MSKNWMNDIAAMHRKYKVNKKVQEFDPEKLNKLLEFRLNFLKEEMKELDQAVLDKDAEEVVDALIDLCVVAIGTLDIFEIDSEKAWNKVHEANMNKKVGIKESRPNPLGLPDLIKPEEWVGPDHSDNHGLLTIIERNSGR